MNVTFNSHIRVTFILERSLCTYSAGSLLEFEIVGASTGVLMEFYIFLNNFLQLVICPEKIFYDATKGQTKSK